MEAFVSRKIIRRYKLSMKLVEYLEQFARTQSVVERFVLHQKSVLDDLKTSQAAFQRQINQIASAGTAVSAEVDRMADIGRLLKQSLAAEKAKMQVLRNQFTAIAVPANYSSVLEELTRSATRASKASATWNTNLSTLWEESQAIRLQWEAISGSLRGDLFGVDALVGFIKEKNGAESLGNPDFEFATLLQNLRENVNYHTDPTSPVPKNPLNLSLVFAFVFFAIQMVDSLIGGKKIEKISEENKIQTMELDSLRAELQELGELFDSINVSRIRFCQINTKLRKRPTTKSVALATVKKGQEVRVLEPEDGKKYKKWIKVAYVDYQLHVHQEGWVMKKYFKRW